MSNHTPKDSDRWADWLQNHRYGGDQNYREHIRDKIESYVRRGLNLLTYQPHMTLVDVGCGDGVLGFQALKEQESTLQLIFTDVSAAILSVVEKDIKTRNLEAQCRVVACNAQAMDHLESQSVDIVATRAALAYVPQKKQAIQEFYRILKPGGQLLLVEPIFKDEALATAKLKDMVESGDQSVELRLLHQWKAAQFPDQLDAIQTSTLCHYNERDLFSLLQTQGFKDIHLELHIDQNAHKYPHWDIFLKLSPHPLAPTLEQILESRMSQTDAQLFESIFRPLVESGGLTSLDRIAYLKATR